MKNSIRNSVWGKLDWFLFLFAVDLTDEHREDIHCDVFDRVTVDGGDCDRTSPLVVLLVNVLVETGMVAASMAVVEEDFSEQLE